MGGMKERISKLCGEAALRRSALRLGDGERILRDASEGRMHALEIGTYRGCTAAALAQWCVRVTTVDMIVGQFINDRGLARESLWRALGLGNVDVILVSNDTEKARVLERLDFDFAFIDGAHDASSVAFDFNLVRRCGRVLFHDYATGTGVKTVVDAVQSGHVNFMENFALWTA